MKDSDACSVPQRCPISHISYCDVYSSLRNCKTSYILLWCRHYHKRVQLDRTNMSYLRIIKQSIWLLEIRESIFPWPENAFFSYSSFLYKRNVFQYHSVVAIVGVWVLSFFNINFIKKSSDILQIATYRFYNMVEDLKLFWRFSPTPFWNTALNEKMCVIINLDSKQILCL